MRYKKCILYIQIVETLKIPRIEIKRKMVELRREHAAEKDET